MPEFVFRGRVTLSGALFYLDALTREEAIRRVKTGLFDEADYDLAEIVDCEINPSTVEEN